MITRIDKTNGLMIGNLYLRKNLSDRTYTPKVTLKPNKGLRKNSVNLLFLHLYFWIICFSFLRDILDDCFNTFCSFSCYDHCHYGTNDNSTKQNRPDRCNIVKIIKCPLQQVQKGSLSYSTKKSPVAPNLSGIYQVHLKCQKQE